MDENSPDISPSNSGKNKKLYQQASIQRVHPCIQSNVTESKLKSVRRPSHDKLIHDTTLSSINSNQQKTIFRDDITFSNHQSLCASSDTRQSQYNSSPTPPQLAEKQRPRTRTPLSKDDDHNDHIDSDYDNKQAYSPCSIQSQHEQVSMRMTKPKMSDQETVTAMKTATAAAAEIVSTSDTMEVTKLHTDNMPNDMNAMDRVSEMVMMVVDDLERQVVDLDAALKRARQKTVWMSGWENDMVQRIQHFKAIQDDVMDSVDILVEFDQVMMALDEEKQQTWMDKQAQVDQMMNHVAERLFEVEETRQTIGRPDRV
ncbi:hypothetical protein BCR42DRAFT_399534 [Absidia repens]|uniref:Uncharacterized protein n=1 Tax=Absidia repens TaxID=90262 RepID=A0A1X2IZZ5_9FUNG|nr:hypothetical protein BCR42DRAFT_399534 [Absidia repens]